MSIKDSYGYISIANPQTLNLYTYCQNNPVSRTDPNGNWSSEERNAAIAAGWSDDDITNMDIFTSEYNYAATHKSIYSEFIMADVHRMADEIRVKYAKGKEPKFRGSDSKKREKSQTDQTLGERGTKERDENSRDLHDSKSGLPNYKNKSWGQLKNRDYWIVPAPAGAGAFKFFLSALAF